MLQNLHEFHLESHCCTASNILDLHIFYIISMMNFINSVCLSRVSLSSHDPPSQVLTYTKTIVGKWRSTYVIFHLFKKPLFLVKKRPEKTMWLRPHQTIQLSTLNIQQNIWSFWDLFNDLPTQIGLKICSHIVK